MANANVPWDLLTGALEKVATENLEAKRSNGRTTVEELRELSERGRRSMRRYRKEQEAARRGVTITDVEDES